MRTSPEEGDAQECAEHKIVMKEKVKAKLPSRYMKNGKCRQCVTIEKNFIRATKHLDSCSGMKPEAKVVVKKSKAKVTKPPKTPKTKSKMPKMSKVKLEVEPVALPVAVLAHA